ncbi:iron chaperone [Maritimibacter sp. HL-12]|uniref:iron chaperone n=1 Tax=Maritimibacter sp. HL-12 TaxID=1162418 RepID=UPI000A0F20CE|nr:DUF1801 domain-containing protein [Maritimibacter sp. HL-12]SMH30399.1 Uncharacterized conserved protein YdhG, YjbR/CyaY-like superfamily, DUF1801 family [Maritimibacter sp. HL-12]
MTAPDTHDAYLATLPPDQRAALEALRVQIAAAAPGAREVISYGVPAFRAGPGKGKVLVGYAAMTAHLGFYVFEGDLLARFADRLQDFSISKGTVRFTPAHPLPEPLVHEIVAARLAEIAAEPQ